MGGPRQVILKIKAIEEMVQIPTWKPFRTGGATDPELGENQLNPMKAGDKDNSWGSSLLKYSNVLIILSLTISIGLLVYFGYFGCGYVDFIGSVRGDTDCSVRRRCGNETPEQPAPKSN